MLKRNTFQSDNDFNLKMLNVIDKLEIGPVKIEKNRFIAPYKVVQNGMNSTIDLIYHYEEPVFTPGEAESQNLANMIAAQVALNYGLFCNELIFHGYYDKTDRQFLKDMAINTAREIYVIKFLNPNPFLVGEAAHLPTIKNQNILQADLIFLEDTPAKKTLSPWDVDHQKYGILSSGGKDSLLSFGLLNELGYETHPLFVNESGRHWYTALNGYRYFKQNYQLTSRIWTNADRLFNWMLRHLPFIRKDYARLRSDEYPIRLWTVAVFIFGVLPVIKKRGIGHVVIGDEFDTTRRLSYQGITHYDGLYDQSRYFDNAMTRYFLRKGWGCRQFSILRQLSEMLIIKLLAKRYPELQRHQVSCHAAHIENDRVYPCGHCEKCRRIVGMLLAMDADPENCGYNKQQIEHCLMDITLKGVHQEGPGVRELLFLLNQKKLIKINPSKLREHPEILKIRVDPERSPITGIPLELRQSLFQIFLDYADGALKREHKEWLNFDIFNDPDMKNPYP